MAEPIEMLFGMKTHVSPSNRVLEGVEIPSWEGARLMDVHLMGNDCNTELCNNG